MQANTSGTPKNSSTPQLLSVSEKISLMVNSRQTAKDFKLENLESILENIRYVLLPMVEYLDKPFAEIFKYCMGFPRKYIKHRGLEISKGQDGYLAIILCRDGEWFIYDGIAKQASKCCQLLDSKALAKLIIAMAEHYAYRYLKVASMDAPEILSMLEELKFPKEYLLYNAIIQIMPKYLENVNKLIAQREQRYQVMKANLSVATDYLAGLDPLQTLDKELEFPEYSIWDQGHCYTATYLAEISLIPMLDDLLERSTKDFSMINVTDYSVQSHNLNIKSLDGFIDNLVYKIKKVIDYQKMLEKCDNPKKLPQSIDQRLPFDKQEKAKIAELVKQLKN